MARPKTLTIIRVLQVTLSNILLQMLPPRICGSRLEEQQTWMCQVLWTLGSERLDILLSRSLKSSIRLASNSHGSCLLEMSSLKKTKLTGGFHYCLMRNPGDLKVRKSRN